MQHTPQRKAAAPARHFPKAQLFVKALLAFGRNKLYARASARRQPALGMGQKLFCHSLSNAAPLVFRRDHHVRDDVVQPVPTKRPMATARPSSTAVTSYRAAASARLVCSSEWVSHPASVRKAR